MTGSLAEKTAAWIAKGGIPLEYEAARALSQAQFSVAQGESYATESEAGLKLREIDVVGTLSFETNVTTMLVVECKRTTDHPWLVLSNRRQVDTRGTLEATVARAPVRDAVVQAYGRPGGSGIPIHLLPVDRPGFSAVVALDKEDDDDRNKARNAIAQAVSAASGLVDNRQFDPIVAWPVVVIDGPLLELSYDALGTQEIREVPRKRIFWSGVVHGKVAIDIVRSNEFHRYADEAYWGLKDLGARLAAELSGLR